MTVLSTSEQPFSENPPVDIKQYSHVTSASIKIAYSDSFDNIELESEYQEIYSEFIREIINSNLFDVKQNEPKYDTDVILCYFYLE